MAIKMNDKTDKYMAIVLCTFFIVVFASIVIGTIYDSKNCKGTIQQSTDFAHFSCNNGESSVKEISGKTYYICTCKESK